MTAKYYEGFVLSNGPGGASRPPPFMRFMTKRFTILELLIGAVLSFSSFSSPFLCTPCASEN